jgi:hypothetical protein
LPGERKDSIAEIGSLYGLMVELHEHRAHKDGAKGG